MKKLQDDTEGKLYETRDDQHKFLPLLGCTNPTSLLFWKIVVNSKNDSEIWKNPSVCRACLYESIDIQHIEIWSIFTPCY